MAANFPSNPVHGNTYDYKGIRYTYLAQNESGTPIDPGFWSVTTPGTFGAATEAEVNAGLNTVKYVSPKSLRDSEYLQMSDLPASSTSASGIVQLSSSTSSTSTTLAATASAAKSAYDRGSLGVTHAASAQSTANTGVANASTAQTKANSAYTLASGKANSSHTHAEGDLPNASTAAQGVVQLTNAVTSNSNVLAATASAVKEAYDRGTAGVNAAASALNTANTKLNSSSYTASDILTKLKTVDGDSSGLDVPYLGGAHHSFLKPSSSKSASGYWKCNYTGVIIQWGELTGNSNTWAYKYFPIIFPSACVSITTNIKNNGIDYAATAATSPLTIVKTSSSTSRFRWGISGGSTAWGGYYIAIGY